VRGAGRRRRGRPEVTRGGAARRRRAAPPSDAHVVFHRHADTPAAADALPPMLAAPPPPDRSSDTRRHFLAIPTCRDSMPLCRCRCALMMRSAQACLIFHAPDIMSIFSLFSRRLRLHASRPISAPDTPSVDYFLAHYVYCRRPRLLRRRRRFSEIAVDAAAASLLSSAADFTAMRAAASPYASFAMRHRCFFAVTTPRHFQH